MKLGDTVLLSILLAAGLCAQQTHQHPGTSKAVLMSGFGKVHHRISTQKPEAQRFFDQGLNLMYGFNHEEAVRSFQDNAPAIGTGNLRIPGTVCAFQAIVPKTTDWRAFPATYVWDTGEPALEPSYSVSNRS